MCSLWNQVVTRWWSYAIFPTWITQFSMPLVYEILHDSSLEYSFRFQVTLDCSTTQFHTIWQDLNHYCKLLTKSLLYTSNCFLFLTLNTVQQVIFPVNQQENSSLVHSLWKACFKVFFGVPDCNCGILIWFLHFIESLTSASGMSSDN